MKMQLLALGLKWGPRVVPGTAARSASAASRPSAWNNEARASAPMPLALVARKSRRVSLMMSSGLISITGDEFVEIHDDTGGGDKAGLLHRVRRRFGFLIQTENARRAV